MQIRNDLIAYYLKQTGLPVSGCSIVGAIHGTSSPATFHALDNGFLRVDWFITPLLAQIQQVDSLLLAADPNGKTPAEQDEGSLLQAINGYKNLPNYATWTPQETQDNITNMILGGQTKAQVEANIVALPATIAGMKTGLTTLADAVIDIRTALAILGKLMTYIRIIAVRH